MTITLDTPGRVSSKPFRRWLIERMNRYEQMETERGSGPQIVADQLGCDETYIRRMRDGEYATVDRDWLEDALNRAGVYWWEVYGHTRGPKVRLTDEPVKKVDRRGRDASKKRGKPPALTDDDLMVLHRLHTQRGLSMRELARRVYKAKGYRNANSCATQIGLGWKRMGLTARDRRNATAESNRHRHDDTPLCSYVKANGQRCQRKTAMGKCWHHRPENLNARLEYLHTLDDKKGAANGEGLGSGSTEVDDALEAATDGG